MQTQRIALNLVPGRGMPPKIYLSQYDDRSRRLEFELYDGTDPYDIPSATSIVIQGTKPDKKGFQYDCDYADGVASCIVAGQMTACGGNILCELVLSKDGGILGTAKFVIVVERAALLNETVISQTDLPLIVDAAKNALLANASAKDAAESASAAGASETNAKASETAAKTSETNAASSATAAANSAAASQKSVQNAETNARSAQSSAEKAAKSASDAASGATAAAESAKKAEDSAKSAQTLAGDAAGSAASASGYAEAAAGSATAASASAKNAAGYAEEIEYRIGINPATGHPAIYHYTKETS